jgi:hypothetical protein
LQTSVGRIFGHGFAALKGTHGETWSSSTGAEAPFDEGSRRKATETWKMSSERVRGVTCLAWTTGPVASTRGITLDEFADTTEDVLNREQRCS